jgi:ion channel POLLUX/CASTOR
MDYGIDTTAIRNGMSSPQPLERLLILGWNRRGPLILEELGHYLPPDSQVLVLAAVDVEQMETDSAAVQSQRMRVTFETGNPIDRPTLEKLAAGGYEFIIILSPADAPELQIADASVMISLLHLRDIARTTGQAFSIISEILDVQNRDLAEVTSADDVIMSDRLVALAMTQIAENKDVVPVFVQLLAPGGPDIYLKPAEDYITPNRPVNFYTVVEAARRKSQTAIGYRLLSEAGAEEQSFGVHLNPDKSAPVIISTKDRIIVLAEE